MTITDLLRIFADEFKKLSWKGKLLLLLLIGLSYLAVAALLYPDATASRFQLVGHFVRAWQGGEHLALDPQTRVRLSQLRDTLSRELNAQFDTRLDKACTKEQALADDLFNSWTLSSTSLALPAEASKHSAAILARMDCWKHEDNVTWREFPDDNSRKIHITAWNVWAQVKTHNRFDKEACEFLLGQQHPTDGSWPVYADTQGSIYASTYATAVTLIALKAASVSPLCPEGLAKRLDLALDRGRTWLSTYSENGTWRDYPVNKSFGNLRPGLSGFVVFALHFISSDQPPRQQDAELDRSFVSQLRVEELPAAYAELSGIMIPGGRIDHIRVFIRPSQLLGITAAYRSLSLLERARALRWIRMTAPQMDRADALTASHPWIAAEYVIALNEILSK